MKLIHVAFALVLVGGLSGLACSPAEDTGGGSGGSSGSGGSGSGGNGSGGSGSGGKTSSGGSSSGGSSSGGSSSGGSSSGGSSSGGSSSGGAVGSGGLSAGGSKGQGGSKGGSSGGGGASGGGFAAVATLLNGSCVGGTCHDGSAHVDLRNNSGLYMRLVNMSPSASKTMATCKTMKLVVPNDTATSVLSQIIKAKVTGCSNARMPDECSTNSSNPRACLTTAQISTIDSWITAGAPM